MDRAAGASLAVDHVPTRGARAEGLVVVFDGGPITTSTELRLPSDELSEARFVPVEELGGYLPELQARRAVAAMEARRTGAAVNLEDGHPV